MPVCREAELGRLTRRAGGDSVAAAADRSVYTLPVLARKRMRAVMRASFAAAAIVVPTARCFVCVSVCGPPGCEGDVRVNCTLACSESRRDPLSPPQVCHADEKREDCAAFGR